MKMIKKGSFAVALAAALLAISGSAVAEGSTSGAVKLSDADLDRVTAGATTLFLLNPGNGPGVVQTNRNHDGCINCLGMDALKTVGMVVVETPNKTMIHFIRQSPFATQAY